MKSTLLFILVASLAIASLARRRPRYDLSKDDADLFTDWLADRPGRYGITPSNTMLRYKLDVFSENVRLVRQLQAAAGNETLFDLNDFADMAHEDFLRLYTNPDDHSASIKRMALETLDESEISALPKVKDWRSNSKYTVVTPVQDQGVCGSCWTFATAGNTEGAWALKYKRDAVKFSEQQVLDCTMTKGRNGSLVPFGCDGGIVGDAYDQLVVSKSGGLRTTAAYGEYRAKVYPCRVVTEGQVARVGGWFRIDPKTPESIMAALVKYGPLNVGVDATNWAYYHSGVISTACGNIAPSTNHAVLLVGYGIKDDIPVWIVKNSWNTNWGEDGYIYIKRTDTNFCRLYDRPLTVVLADENVEPSPQN